MEKYLLHFELSTITELRQMVMLAISSKDLSVFFLNANSNDYGLYCRERQQR